MTQVKICGISDTDMALAATGAGADYLGLVFAPSRRRVTTDTAAEIAAAVRRLAPHPLMAGVFVNETTRVVNRIAADCRLDRVQLSGDEGWEYSLDIERPLIKAIHVWPDTTPDLISAEMERGRALFEGSKLIFLLDTHSDQAYGGTGKTFDWELLKGIPSHYPVLIGGGLTPENVGGLVGNFKPWGVDVSSGVETNGKKDPAKIQAFVQAVRAVPQ